MCSVVHVGAQRRGGRRMGVDIVAVVLSMIAVHIACGRNLAGPRMCPVAVEVTSMLLRRHRARQQRAPLGGTCALHPTVMATGHANGDI